MHTITKFGLRYLHKFQHELERWWEGGESVKVKYKSISCKMKTGNVVIALRAIFRKREVIFARRSEYGRRFMSCAL